MTVALMLPILLAAAPAWQTINTEGGVVVQIKDAGRGHTVVKGTTTFDVSAQRVISVLADLESFDKWIPTLATWTVLRREAKSAFVYARHTLPWPMDDRDYRVRYVWDTGKDGSYTLEARSTTVAGPAPVDGVIRLADVRSKWTVTPLGSDKVRVSYMYHGDLGGNLPKTIERSAWKDEPVTVLKALMTRIEGLRQP